MEYDKASIVHDHKDNRKAGGQNPLAVTKVQFYAMFYHVTERLVLPSQQIQRKS